MFRIAPFLIFLPLIAVAHPMTDLQKAYDNKGKNYQPRTRHLDQNGRAKFVNHLILQSSPYLLQHAHNPLNWYSFSDEAFARAKAENKPIFISIGYATCHWCHVMEEESFDDLEVAEFINQHFIAIKVDREIRPDVDNAYMQVSQLLNGSGGWPLNALITPDGKAFFAGTYFPKVQLLSILNKANELWKTKQNKMIEQADKIEDTLNKRNDSGKSVLNNNISEHAISLMIRNFDDLQGGFGEAPKFPHETMLLLFLDEQNRHPDDNKLLVINETLSQMASGGFYDNVGGGFHRYSTDNAWLVPHFEKMLYNQAQLSLVYTRAYKLTANPFYKRISTQTLDYAIAEMRDKNGGFFSATDADSEGEEGTFFTFSDQELATIFTKSELQKFSKWFDLTTATDFEDAHLIRFADVAKVASADYPQIDTLLKKLYEVRQKRIPPLTDHKILLSWNALMLPALFEAGAIFAEPKYTDAGLKLANYLHAHFYQNGELMRVSIDGKLEAKALFEDYAYLADAYLTVFDYTYDSVWLERAEQLVKKMRQRFWDEDNFGFNITDDNRYLKIDYKDAYDGAIPAANGVAYNALIKLKSRVRAPEIEQQAEQLLSAFAAKINQNPYNYSTFILGFNNSQKGETNNIQYAYNGKIRILTTLKNNQLKISLNLAPNLHINSNKPLQDALIKTEVTATNPKTIKSITYPKPSLIKLSFSKQQIAVYQDNPKITATLDPAHPSNLSLTLQACHDKACLPPTNIKLY